MKQEERWAPVPTVSGKVEGDGRFTVQSRERVEHAQMPCAPGEAIARTLEAYGGRFHAQGIMPVPRYQAGLPLVNFEAGEMEYVLALLVEQAVQAMQSGGRLWVLAYEERVWTNVIVRSLGQAVRPGRYVVLAVKDAGQGRTPDLEGIEAVVIRRGGGIVCQAVPTQGTRVNVYLPVARLAEACMSLRVARR